MNATLNTNEPLQVRDASYLVRADGYYRMPTLPGAVIEVERIERITEWLPYREWWEPIEDEI